MGNTTLCSSFMFSKTGGGNTCAFFVKRRGPLAFCIMLHTHMSYIIYGELRIKSILFLGVKCVSVHERSCWASGELCEHFFTRGGLLFIRRSSLMFSHLGQRKKGPRSAAAVCAYGDDELVRYTFRQRRGIPPHSEEAYSRNLKQRKRNLQKTNNPFFKSNQLSQRHSVSHCFGAIVTEYSKHCDDASTENLLNPSALLPKLRAQDDGGLALKPEHTLSPPPTSCLYNVRTVLWARPQTHFNPNAT